MEIRKGRPVITKEDYPVTVYKALLRSTSTPRDNESVVTDWVWRKTAQDSWDALRDGFGFIHPDQQELWQPDGEATLYMSVDDLEHTLVSYGVRMIDEDPEKYDTEITQVNSVLNALDKALKRNKYGYKA